MPPRELSHVGLRARELWIQAAAAKGTLVDIYLRSRGIVTSIPPTLRFLSLAKHSPSNLFLPAMLAAVTVWPDDGLGNSPDIFGQRRQRQGGG